MFGPVNQCPVVPQDDVADLVVLRMDERRCEVGVELAGGSEEFMQDRGVQDLAVAVRLEALARERGLGVELPYGE